jgi:hypothetical protein
VAGLGLSGLASGVDTAAIVEQLMAIDRQGKTRLQLRQGSFGAQQTTLRDLKAKLDALKAAAADLRSPATWSEGQTVESSDAARVAVARTGGAPIGGYSVKPEDRAENVRRTAHAAALLAEAGVVALVALVSPYASDRATARAIHEAAGLPFHEIWVSTGLAECEQRDPKGLYARARAGELPGLTGVGDVYEIPESPDVEIGGAEPIPAAAARVLAALA